MLQYDIYLPLLYNDGREIELEKFELTRNELVQTFGGLTVLPGSGFASGFWRIGSVVHKDQIRIFKVLTAQHDPLFWDSYKNRLQARFEQKEILIIRSEVWLA